MWTTAAVLIALVAARTVTALGTSPPLYLKTDAWAFLVAGSRNYSNYRHQAGVSHAYQSVLNQGIPRDRIIVMMFDDIAYHKENPNPGQIFNSPNGPNVYKGVKVDYKGWDVNPTNFLNVLSGNKTAMKGIGTGRVIQSNENSTVFVYFTDHGGPGVLFFPDYVTLSADDLHNTVKEMHRRKLYDKLIMYIEACFVGSIFEGILEEDTGVLVISSTARDDESRVFYCTAMNATTCKGDEFSVRLWEYYDSAAVGAVKTLNDVYQRVRTGVAMSHVQLYGDLSVGSYAFIPNQGKNPIITESKKMSSRSASPAVDAVPVKDATEFYLKNKITTSKNLKTRMETQKLLDNHNSEKARLAELFGQLVRVATADAPQLREEINDQYLPLNLEMFPCYKQLLNQFFKYCLSSEASSPDDGVLINTHIHKFANICVLRINTTNLLKKLPSICALY